jgi:hypothetical protein
MKCNLSTGSILPGVNLTPSFTYATFVNSVTNVNDRNTSLMPVSHFRCFCYENFAHPIILIELPYIMLPYIAIYDHMFRLMSRYCSHVQSWVKLTQVCPERVVYPKVHTQPDSRLHLVGILLAARPVVRLLIMKLRCVKFFALLTFLHTTMTQMSYHDQAGFRAGTITKDMLFCPGQKQTF